MVKEYKAIYQTGTISFENIPSELRIPGIYAMHGELGIQIARDGRVYVCINRQAFIRFSPWPNGRMRPSKVQ